MPELPEVETVRRMLEQTVRGRRIRSATVSGLSLREAVDPGLPRRLRGRTIESLGRRGKYLLIGLSGGLTLLSHLGMSGRWLVLGEGEDPAFDHVHVRIRFSDGSRLWFQDTRRFGLLRAVPTGDVDHLPELEGLGPDALTSPSAGPALQGRARGARTPVKTFLMDQRRIAGLGNIYASEILHRARLDPRRRAGSVTAVEWRRVARQIDAVLAAAVAQLGTTFGSYRTIWNEPGEYGKVLRVYDRAGRPCRKCGTPIRRIVQAQRSTYYCPVCQARPGSRAARSGARSKPL